MSGRVIHEVVNGARKVSIVLANEVKDQGFKRVIDAIAPEVIAETATKVAAAFNGSAMLTESQKAETNSVLVTSMQHSSDEDPIPHWSVFMRGPEDKFLYVGHVAADSEKQQPAK